MKALTKNSSLKSLLKETSLPYFPLTEIFCVIFVISKIIIKIIFSSRFLVREYLFGYCYTIKNTIPYRGIVFFIL